MAFFFLPLNQILMSGVASNELASASGVSNFTRHDGRQLFNRRHGLDLESPQRLSSRGTVPNTSTTPRMRGPNTKLGSVHITSAARARPEFVNQVISSQSSTLGRQRCIQLMGANFSDLDTPHLVREAAVRCAGGESGALNQIAFPCRIIAVTSPYIVARRRNTATQILDGVGGCAMR